MYKNEKLCKACKSIVLIVKYANVWCFCRQLCWVCFSSLIIHEDTSDNTQISNISILTVACNASKLVSYSSGMGTYNANVRNTGDNYHIKYSSTHKQCISFSRREAQYETVFLENHGNCPRLGLNRKIFITRLG